MLRSACVRRVLCAVATSSLLCGLASAQSKRVSLDEFVKDPAKLDALKRGVRTMKARKPSDPTSWFFQAAIHGVTDEMINAALKDDPQVANVDRAKFWNQCPHFNQNSADFPIWHRAYLHYFEGILQQAANDTTLRLPYWDYSTNRSFPAAFADPDVDPATKQPRNPLYDVRREIFFMRGDYDLSARSVDTAIAFQEPRFFGPDETTGLAGGVWDANWRTKGKLEQTPHDNIHRAVGGGIGDPSDPENNRFGLMANVMTAAFDPIFWVHHANIDRLTSVWECLPARVWGSVPPSSYIDAAPWHFHDSSLQVQNLPRRDYLTKAAFRAAYSTDDPSCKRLSDTELTVPQTTDSLKPSAAPMAASQRAQLGENNDGVQLSPSAAVSRRIPVQSGPTSGQPSLMAALKDVTRRPRAVLELRGVTSDAPSSVGFDVYVNLPKDAKPAPDSPYFVGTLTLFGLEHEHRDDSTRVHTFDITALLLRGNATPGAIDVLIVPFDLFTPRKAGVQPLRRAGNVRIASMGLVLTGGQ